MTHSSLLLLYSGYFRNSQSSLARQTERGTAELKTLPVYRSQSSSSPICSYRVGKVITSRVNFLKANTETCYEIKADVGFYPRHCQELFFHQLRYQITIKSVFQKSNILTAPHASPNPSDSYHQTVAPSKGVINDSLSWRNRPYDTPEHPVRKPV